MYPDSKPSSVSEPVRHPHLRDLLEERVLLRAIEAHNALAALIAARTRVLRNGRPVEFDAHWSSSLTDSLSRGRPDTEFVDFTTRAMNLQEVFGVSEKPVIYDGDTGGLTEHFALHMAALERMGVSAVIIEDKTGAKRNSLFGTEVKQIQEQPQTFAEKIAAGKRAQKGGDFMLIARVESLILGKGVADALARAAVYLEAGADGVMIHHKERDPEELWDFCAGYRAQGLRAPLVAVPSAYSQVSESELAEAGIRIVIYANQLLRSAYPAMLGAAESILRNGRALEADQACLPISEVLRLVEGGDPS